LAKKQEKQKSKGVKLLVVGKEGSFKTRTISKLTDSLVASTDNKAFKGKVAHFRYNTYKGVDDFIETVNSKTAIYMEKHGKLPRNLVIDSITHLQNNMERWANEKFNGFSIYSNLGKDILLLNEYLEEVVIPNGVNVILTAHCTYNADIARYEIKSPGRFGDNGSWMSVTDDAVFLEPKGNKVNVHIRNLKFPCRSSLDQNELPDMMDWEEYDINKHIEILENNRFESDQYEI
jgi:hypothetical protein